MRHGLIPSVDTLFSWRLHCINRSGIRPLYFYLTGQQCCELYIVQTSLTDESKILVTEVWESKEAHQGSLANEKVRELIGKAKPIIVGMEHHPAIFVGGHGL